MEQPYTNDPFDQWRLSQAGGSIHTKKNGQIVFRFETWEQYQKYMALSVERSKFKEGVLA